MCLYSSLCSEKWFLHRSQEMPQGPSMFSSLSSRHTPRSNLGRSCLEYWNCSSFSCPHLSYNLLWMSYVGIIFISFYSRLSFLRNYSVTFLKVFFIVDSVTDTSHSPRPPFPLTLIQSPLNFFKQLWHRALF